MSDDHAKHTITELITHLRSSSEHETFPPATAMEVTETESAIGAPLPQSFQAFVTSYSNGAYLFGVQEISAVGDGNEQIRAIQDIHRVAGLGTDVAVPFRHGGSARYGTLVPYSLDSNGNEWCFIVDESEEEYAVAYLDTTGHKLYGKLRGFTEWLAILVETRSEVIRALYSEEEILDELELG